MAEACPFCEGSRLRAGPERAGARYRVCARCGSAFVPDPPIRFREYYEAYDPELVRDLPGILRARYEAVLAELERRAPGRRLLEVGCGNGHFLTVARDRGWRVAGTELSRAHVERAVGAGLDVRYGDLRGEGLWDGSDFDAVVLIEVLEHVPGPLELLRAVTERLVEEGITYVTTPNYGSVTRRLLGGRWSVLDPEHVALATPRGLRAALRGAGQGIVRLESKNLYLSEYRALFRRGSAPGEASRAAATAELRDRIEGSGPLRAAKRAANAVLGLTGLGESLECLARRPGSAG